MAMTLGLRDVDVPYLQELGRYIPKYLLGRGEISIVGKSKSQHPAIA